MNRILMNLSVALTAAFIVSCSQQQEEDKITAGIMNAPKMGYVKSEPTVINISKIEEMEQTDFDGLIKTVKYVPLDNKELVGVINDVLIGNNRLYVLDSNSKNVFVYDMSGKLIKCIDSQGYARNEFLLPFSICFQGKELVVKDAQQLKYLHYDKDGFFLKTTSSISGLYVESMGNYFINQMGWRNSYSDNVNYHLVSTIKDSICYRGFEFAPIQKDYVESTQLKYNDKHELLFHPVLSDTIYHILSASKYTAKYVIKHPKSIWQKSNEWLSYDETTQLLKGDYKEVANFYEVENYLIMSLSMYDKANKALTSRYLLYDKRLEKGFFVKNPTSNVITNTCSLILNATFGNTCISSLNPYQLKCDLKRFPKIKVTDKQLSDIIMQSTENSNPVLVLYTLK